MCESPLWCIPAALLNLQQTPVIKQVIQAFHFLFRPNHEAVFLAVLRRDLHKAELLIASLQGAHLDRASHPFFCGKKKKKKDRNLRNSGKKRISAYA